MRIGLFGGAFNPPHLAHLIVAESARQHAKLDRVLWIPTGHPPHKPTEPLAKSEDRIEMVRRAIKDNTTFTTSEIETGRPGPSYMIETIALLKDKNPDDQHFLIIGGDSLKAFHTWFRYEDIIRQIELIVFDRPGLDYSEVDDAILNVVNWIAGWPRVGISSSDIRERIRAGRSIRYLVPESVEHYIRRRNLYSA